MTFLGVMAFVLMCAVIFIGGLFFGAYVIERFWAWYDDKVWDEQEEDQPKPDDFPGRK